MSYQERFTWVHAIATLLVAGYFAWAIGSQLGTTPFADVAFRAPTLVAIVAMIVLTIVGSVGLAIYTAVQSHRNGTDDIHEIDTKDERDRAIARRGDLAHHRVTSVLMVAVFALVLLERSHAAIALALFFTFAAGELASAATKIRAYRRGV